MHEAKLEILAYRHLCAFIVVYYQQTHLSPSISVFEDQMHPHEFEPQVTTGTASPYEVNKWT